jgi:hypothetical protein
VNLCAPQRIRQFNPNGDDRNISQNITLSRMALRGHRIRCAKKPARRPVRGKMPPKRVDFREKCNCIDQLGPGSTQDITPLTLRDNGQNGPPFADAYRRQRSDGIVIARSEATWRSRSRRGALRSPGLLPPESQSPGLAMTALVRPKCNVR